MSLTNMGKKKEIKKMMTHLAPRTSKKPAPTCRWMPAATNQVVILKGELPLAFGGFF